MRKLSDLVRTWLSDRSSATPASNSQSAIEFDLQVLDDAVLGDFYLDLIERPNWVSRRVETVRIPDHESLEIRERSVSIDVDAKELRSRLQSRGLPIDSVVIPLGLVPKGLMLDFDVRLDSGVTTSLLTRQEDASVGSLVLLAAIRRGGNSKRLSKEIVNALQRLSFDFPIMPAEDGELALSTDKLPPPDQLSVRFKSDWDAIQEDPRVRRLMRQFAESYLPLAKLELNSSRVIIKYRRLENDVDSTMKFLASRRGPDKRWAFYQKRPYWPVVIRAGHIGRATSEHLRVVAPEGTNFVFAMLSPAPDGERPISLRYNSRISLERAAMYTNGVAAGDYYFVAALVPSLGGFIRPSLWLTGIVAFVLGLGAVAEELWMFLETARESTDAAVTLLLVVPTLFVAYILREGEHHVRRRLLMPARNLSLATLLPLLVAAVSLFVDLEPFAEELRVEKLLAPIWGLSSIVALGLFVSLAAIGIRVRDAQRFVSAQAHVTLPRSVYGAVVNDGRSVFRRLLDAMLERVRRWDLAIVLILGIGLVSFVTLWDAARGSDVNAVDRALLGYYALVLALFAAQHTRSRIGATLTIWVTFIGCFSAWYFVESLREGSLPISTAGDVVRALLGVSALMPELLLVGILLGLFAPVIEWTLSAAAAAKLDRWLHGLAAGPTMAVVYLNFIGSDQSFVIGWWLALATVALVGVWAIQATRASPNRSAILQFFTAFAVSGGVSLVAAAALV